MAFIPCASCARPVLVDGLGPGVDLDRITCPGLECQARHGWTPERWEGAARMALARRTAGVVLTDLDDEALERVGIPHTRRP